MEYGRLPHVTRDRGEVRLQFEIAFVDTAYKSSYNSHYCCQLNGTARRATRLYIYGWAAAGLSH